jgi:peptide/nickel transport system permease protein
MRARGSLLSRHRRLNAAEAAASADVSGATPGTRGRSPGFLPSLLRRPIAVGCIVYLLVLIVAGVVAPIVLPGVAGQRAGNLLALRQGPSLHHLLGTDTLGRDVLDRLLVGTRITLLGVGEALLVILILGIPFGLIAGYAGGWIDRIVGWLGDLTFAMPAIVVILIVLSVFPFSMTAAMLTFGLLAAPALMRVVRVSTLAVRGELYVDAARVSGLHGRQIITRHIMPRIAGPVIVQVSLLAAVALVVQTGLAFLQVVAPAPAPSWGGMVADGVSVIELQPWLVIPPGVAIALTVMALALLGDAVRDATTARWSAPARRKARSSYAAKMPGRTGAPSHSAALLSVEHLTVSLAFGSSRATVIDDVSFDVDAGEALGLVGETGCGKTVTAMAVLGLLSGSGEFEGGRILLDGRDLMRLTEKELRRLRGREVALISQEPAISLNPVFRIGWQLAEVVRQHQGGSRQAVRARVLELLRLVQLPDPEAVAAQYPHEVSGGMAQRVAIAHALAGNPRLLIADEPTTALDVLVQEEILALLHFLKQEMGIAILLISHDWGVVADLCERALVMYAGQVVECGNMSRLFHQPFHPYTENLLRSSPQIALDLDRTGKLSVDGAPAYLPTIPGMVPPPGQWPAGCHFHPRCSYATAECRVDPIQMLEAEPEHLSRCINYDKLSVPVARR